MFAKHFRIEEYSLIIELLALEEVKTLNHLNDFIWQRKKERESNKHIDNPLPPIFPRMELTKYWLLMYEEQGIKEMYGIEPLPLTDSDINFLYEKSDIKNFTGKTLAELKGGNSYELKDFSQLSYQDKRNIRTYFTGFKKLDKQLTGLRYGTLTVLTGDSGSGKSTLLNQIFLAEALQQKEDVFLFTGEMADESLSDWITSTIANEEDITVHFQAGTMAQLYQPTEQAYKNIVNHLSGKLNILNGIREIHIDPLVRAMNQASANGKKIFLVDSLMLITTDNKDEFLGQKEIATKLSDFAVRHNAIVVLVAHTSKAGNGTAHKDSVAGSKAITNLADYVFYIKRNNDWIGFNKGDFATEIALVKNRHTSALNKKYPLDFNIKRKRFCEVDVRQIEIDGNTTQELSTNTENLYKKYY